jgi:hypothetical protein
VAVVDVAAIESGTVRDIGAWIVAASWVALAGFVVWNWWFFRWRIALAPIAAAAILWIVTSWSG